MLIYRPHRGGLAESMALARTFPDIDSLFLHIAEESSKSGFLSLSPSDLSVSPSASADTRTGWMDTRYVLTSRLGDDHYLSPICIGMMATVFPGSASAADPDHTRLSLWRQLARQSGTTLNKYLAACVDLAAPSVEKSSWMFKNCQK
jgi:hypothetical protein